jgi:tetratricopeptide (TPR) repeat protein
MKATSSRVQLLVLALALSPITGWSQAAAGSGAAKPAAAQSAGAQARDANVERINALLVQVKTAMDTNNWKDALGPLQELLALDPAGWRYYQMLGMAQLNLGQYGDADRAFETGIGLAQKVVAAAAPSDLQNPDSEAARAKAGLGMMWINQGNSYLKQRKNNEAIAAYQKAAELSPNPAIAYFNICATLYNMGDLVGTRTACTKAIAVDPQRADTYFILGSVLYIDGKFVGNKYVTPTEALQALKKYLELAPDGPHAADVKAMLDMAK